MRIGFDAKRAFNNTSGLGNYSRFVISGLIRLFPKNLYAFFTPKIDNHFSHFCPLTGKTQIIEPTGLNRIFTGFWRSFNLNAGLRKNNIDIFHGLSNELPFGIKKTGIKTVVTIHDLIFLRFPELYKPIDRYIYRQKFEYACHAADKIIAISQQTKTDIIHFFRTDPAKIEVIYQDCDPAFQQLIPEIALQEIKQKYSLPVNYILCVGTLEPRKNQLHLLKAWHESKTEAHLIFVGKTTIYKQELENYIARHLLTGKVKFLPYVPFQELPAIYRLASLFVYPSLFEGFGIPILEALNCEVPVITSTGSCFSEAGGKAAIYVDPNDVNSLTNAIMEISTNSERKNEMKKSGLEHALTFLPEKTIGQLHRVYEMLLR